ncbi:hypothetical protein [Telmatospirillum sp.]|uniref:hypothetical protein n=1 Tax=Telmatospirillum sp. TaxID=2079197 RepID=UPI00283B2D50|nr:hypothetical protein [Telmatospirillum sp.]MDR3440146.1 hypothetical protein [Telmatospirillum sp.]
MNIALNVTQPVPLSSGEAFRHKAVVREIKGLNWENLDGDDLQVVMYLSYIAAVEFAEALRLALDLYPSHEGLLEMAHGELKTKNLLLDDYRDAGDHHEFLAHFLEKHDLTEPMRQRLGRHADAYLAACRSLDENVRAMTVFSREEELSGIFARMLDAEDWSYPGLYAFRHYLSRHITFDSGEGGHHDLVSSFPIDDRVYPFYAARLETFRLVPHLFELTPAAKAGCDTPSERPLM